MGQLKTHAKSNEITAIPALLKLLDIKGCLISIDAIGCQTKIANTIINQGGDYLLAVKSNQKLLFKAVQAALSASIFVVTNTDKINIEQGHGRTEIREYHVLPAGDLVSQFPDWKDLTTIGVALGYRREKSGKATLEYRYYISSSALDSVRFGKAV